MKMKNKILITVGVGILLVSIFLVGWKSHVSTSRFETYEMMRMKESKEKLLRTKVVCWYQSITDYKAFNRTIDDVISHLKETNTDFIFRAFWKYKVIPETCSELPLNQRKTCEKAGYSYENFEKSVNEIKKEIPSIIISAGIPTERIDINEYNPITGKKYTKEELWEMALDPAKWNIINPKSGKLITKKQFQFNRGKLLGSFPPDWDSPSDYDWQKAYAYYPDITNPEFQKLQLSWAKKMIDSGADAIWIDMLFAQARMFYELTKNPYHPAVKEAYEAALKQIDEIHKYAKEKGKYVYVGGWTNFLEIKDSEGNPAYPMPDFDFVVNMIWEEEVKNKKLSEKRWDIFFAKIKKYLGNDTLILVFMDEATVGWQDQPLGIFSQYLNKTEQAKFLEMADSFFSRKKGEFNLPIIFVYPLHGGWMGTNARVLSFGKFKVYDALAPEFETYETIKKLGQEKNCNIFFTNGIIKYIPLEGGFYGIETDKGEKYIPLNLPEEFKKDGLKVWFKAKPKKVATIQMWGKPIEILEIKLIEVQNLSQIKVAILYERITDGIYHPSKIRTYKDLVKILKETKPDLVFRVWWRWTPTPESLPSNNPVYQAGHTYQQLEETLRKLKKDLPEIKYWFGAIPTQRINFEEKNPITGKTYSQNETWQMALDPQKWGINFSKEKLQELAQEKSGTGKYGYFPDVTNKEFQELYLSWAKRQIDAGVNGLFLDMLFAQPRILAKITENPEHPAVKDSLEAIDYLIKEIRDYGKKKGEYIYLCSFGTFIDFPDYTPDLDFVLVTPTVEEVRNLALDEKRWDEIVSKIKERLPEAKILAMIDWAGTTNTPLGVFSQELSKEEQREFLKIADEFFSKKGIIFVCPIHGGFMGQDARILSFGKLKTYDSLAPEFGTYETIKELAQSKK